MQTGTLAMKTTGGCRLHPYGVSEQLTYILVLAIVFLESIFVMSPPMVVQAPSMNIRTHHTTTSSKERDSVIVFTSVPIMEDVEASDTMKQALAEQMRQQGILEAQIAEDVEAERLEQERLAKIKEREDYINSIVCDPSDVSRISGLKEEDFICLTKGTWWEGHEWVLYELEQQHGVNAMFAMSVSTLESGRGTSDRASSKHNYYGIELSGKSWASLDDNTLWWGGMINRVYLNHGHESVYEIGPIYCPPNREWETFMDDKMTELYGRLINNLEATVN